MFPNTWQAGRAGGGDVIAPGSHNQTYVTKIGTPRCVCRPAAPRRPSTAAQSAQTDRRFAARVVVAAVLTMTSLAGGCGQSNRPPTCADADTKNPTKKVKSRGTDAAGDIAAAAKPTNEYWMAAYLAGKRVGYSHTTESRVTSDGRERIRRRDFTELRLSRAGQTLTQRMTVAEESSADGGLRNVVIEIDVGGTRQVTRATVEGPWLKITRQVGNSEPAVSSIPWQAGWGGPFATEQSLTEHPLRPGQTRTLFRFEPALEHRVTVRLTAHDYENMDLWGVPSRLLAITEEVEARPDSVIRTLLWVSDTGQVMKAEMQAMELAMVRAPKALALATFDPGELDLIRNTTVKLAAPLPEPESLLSVTYRIALKDDNPAKVFSLGARQRLIEQIDDRTVRLQVVAAEAARDAPQEGHQVDRPTDGDKLPCPLIQSDDPRVEALAHSVDANEDDAETVARALAALVHREIRTKDFSQAFASAAEVAKVREGDCTEHAVLLAALCRARGVPARVAMGLVYYPPLTGFAYHMWTEAWTGEAWLPLDATEVVGPVGPAHLKIAHSNLATASPLAAFLPVAQVLGQLRIEVEDAVPLGPGHRLLKRA